MALKLPRRVLALNGPALARWACHMRLRLRAASIPSAIGLLVVASLAGAVVLSSSFHTPIPHRGRGAESPTSGDGANGARNSSIVHELRTSPTSSAETLERAEKQLNLIASSSEFADPHVSLVSEPQNWVVTRAVEFDADAFIRSAGLHTDTHVLPTQADTGSTLASQAASSVADLRFVGGGSPGAPGFTGGGFASGGAGGGGGGIGQGMGGVYRGALSDRGTSPDIRALRGQDGNAAAQHTVENAPYHSDTAHTTSPSSNGTHPAGLGVPQTTDPSSGVQSLVGTAAVSVPEPAVLLLMGVGLGGLAFRRRQRRG
jgi:PEP-CTERM motif-containing protein